MTHPDPHQDPLRERPAGLAPPETKHQQRDVRPPDPRSTPAASDDVPPGPRRSSWIAARWTTALGLMAIAVVAALIYWSLDSGEPEVPARDEVIIPFENQN